MGHYHDYRLTVAIILMGVKGCWLNRECRPKGEGKKGKGVENFHGEQDPCPAPLVFILPISRMVRQALSTSIIGAYIVRLCGNTTGGKS